jgi:hypothetical protein
MSASKRISAVRSYAKPAERGIADMVKRRVSWAEFSRVIRATTALSVAGSVMAFASPAYAQYAQTETNNNIGVTVHDNAAMVDGMVLITNGANPGTNNITVTNPTAAGALTINGAAGFSGISANVTQPTTNGLIQIFAQDQLNVNSGTNFGIFAANQGTGSISVNLGGGTVTGLTGGIILDASNGGSVTVTNVGAVSSTNGTGISGISSGGNGNVQISPLSTVSGTTGIIASAAGSGTVSVTTLGNITGTASHGIQERRTSRRLPGRRWPVTRRQVMVSAPSRREPGRSQSWPTVRSAATPALSSTRRAAEST